MPSSARKSSVGTARRGIQKAHIPYRGDNPEVGKKTGIGIAHVERMSDGFEPFEEVLQQADKRTPPKPKGRKKSIQVIQQPESDDEDGEMSMDIDESTPCFLFFNFPLFTYTILHLGPVRYLSSARIPSTPTLRNTSGSSRPVARSSEVDFDDIPSPRPRTSVSRAAKAGPSSLSKPVLSRDFAFDSGSDNEPADYGNDMDVSGVTEMNGNYDAGNSPPSSQSPPQRSSPRRKSFTQIDEDPDGQEEDELEQQPSESPPRMDKGKRKARLDDIQEEEEEVEEEIAPDMNDVQDELSEAERETSPPPKKKQRVTEEEKEKQRKLRPSRSKKENRGGSRSLVPSS